MIVKNEENNISNCLDSVSDLFDEIIIVDTGSTDNTKDMVKKYTDKIYDFKWINDFSAARNFAFSKATNDYVMWLDADDIIKTDDLFKLKNLKNTLSDEIDIIMLKYDIAFDNYNNPTFTYYRGRIFKREKNYLWKDRVHEYIPLTGNITKEDISITHNKKKTNDSERNLNIYKEMEKNNEKLTPRNLYYYGRELFDHKKYEQAIDILINFLDTKEGWVEDNIDSCYLISNCYYYLNQNDYILIWLFNSFKYDTPRKKTCCLIGNHFLKNKQYDFAIYWYNLALALSIKDSGFYESDYDYFIPYINLSTSYYYNGDKIKAKHFYKLSKEIKPNNDFVVQNSKYFENI